MPSLEEHPSLQYRVSNMMVGIEPQALAVFEKYRQRKWYSKEAGGQLFARVTEGAWSIVDATGPRPKDARGKFHFWPDRKAEQKEIELFHTRGLQFVGDWHTHPEQIPKPSRCDLDSISRVSRLSTHTFAGFLLIIVGRENFPKGLSVSFHPKGGGAEFANIPD